MKRFGHDGIKFGTGKQSMRRFLASEVDRVEKLLRFGGGDGNTGPSAERL